MDEFLHKFFYTVYKKKRHAHENNYCKYNDEGLAAFTSSLYLAGLVASFLASPITRKYGRKRSIICGGISFLIGAALNAAAVNLAMLLLGRIMLGVGIGFGNQVPFFILKHFLMTNTKIINIFKYKCNLKLCFTSKTHDSVACSRQFHCICLKWHLPTFEEA